MLHARTAISGLLDLASAGILERMAPRDVVAFFYHTVSDCPLPHITPLYSCKSAADFECDLVYLKERFTLVGHDELAAARQGRKRLPPRAAALSFDDGFAGCFSIVRPLLLKHGIPCTFFIVRDMVDNHALMHRNKVALCLSRLDLPAADERADLAAVAESCGRRFTARSELRKWASQLDFGERDRIDRLCEALNVDIDAFLRQSRPYMTTDQIRKLHADGFTIGAHSLNHPQLARLPWELARAQIVDSCEFVRTLTGRPRVPFAFPFNGIDLPRRRLAELHAEAGVVDLMYDTNYFMKDADFIVNRVWCDTPKDESPPESNLPGILRRARALEPLRALKRRFSGRPH